MIENDIIKSNTTNNAINNNITTVNKKNISNKKSSEIKKDSVGYCTLHSYSIDGNRLNEKRCCQIQCSYFIRLEHPFWTTKQGACLSKKVDYLHKKNNVISKKGRKVGKRK